MVVRIFTTPTCPWCKKLKEWFRKKRVSFQELDVTESDKLRDELIEKTGQMGVPVTEIDDEIIVGFNVARLEEALKKAKGKKLS